MFGWLTTFGVPSRARSTPVTRWLAVTPRALIEGLGQLGGVLYLAPRSSAAAVPEARGGCVVLSADVGPLLSTCHVGLTCAITAEGPREWIDCVDRQGDTLARIYLLPDTDYLAWDGLFAGAVTVDEPNHCVLDRDWLRACHARVLSFHRRRVAGLDLLDVEDVRISLLGRGVARDIAVSESVAMTG